MFDASDAPTAQLVVLVAAADWTGTANVLIVRRIRPQAWPIDFDGGNGRLRRQRLLRLRRCWRRSCILLSGSSRRVRCKTSRILPVESSGTLGFDDQHSAPTQSATKENESLVGRLVNPRCQGQLSLIHHFVH